MTKEWKNEDDIKAELRILTDELRILRHELRNMVAPTKAQNPSRAFLHRQPWPMTPPTSAPERGRERQPKKKR